MSKNKTSFYLILIIEILVVFLTVTGIFPKDAILIITGLLIFYFLFSEVEDSLILFIASIPLFAALPIGNFDSMANWRLLITVLFLVWFLRNFYHKKNPLKDICSTIIRIIVPKSKLAILVNLFLVAGVSSLLVATDLFVGIKKILFLINIFLLFVIIRSIIQKAENSKQIILRLIKAGAFAGFISLIVGYSQLIFVLLKPLHTFWQWWARNIISVFYGDKLSQLLAVSNTWFSYYENSAPTLRMFSVFPDSHSFSLFIIISLAFLTTLLFFKKTHSYKGWLWVVIILSFLVLVFSGSRAIWLSAAVPFGIVLLLYIYGYFKDKKYSSIIRKNSQLIRLFFGFLLIFLISFPVSSLIISQSYQIDGDDASLAFKRAKSLADLEELSVKNRMGIWKASFQSILKHPVLGVGIGNYPIVLEEDISATKRGASAHNLYLDVASEMGLLGLIILLLIFWQIIKRAIKHNLIFAFFLLWIFVYNLFDVVLLNDKVLLLFMVMLGVLYSMSHKQLTVNHE